MSKIRTSLKRLRGNLLYLLEEMSVSERVIFAVFTIILIVTSLVLFQRASNLLAKEIPADGGSISEGIEGYPRYINPLLPITDAGRDLGKLVYSGLMKIDENGSMIPDLAKSVSLSEDGLTYTAILKDDLFFHDNAPVTAYDVEFTIKKATDPLLKSPKAADWSGVTVKVINPNTIEFTLKKPYAPFIDNLSLGILPEHIWKDVGSDAFLFSDFNFKPVGSGPYKIKDVKKNASGLPDYYHFVPFEKYALGKPHVSHIYIHFYPSEQELVTAYKKGEVDSMNAISPQNSTSIDLKRSAIITIPLPRFYAVFFNQNQAKIFTNKSVRQALSLSAPKDDIIKDVLSGYGTKIASPLIDSKVVASSTTYEESFAKAKDLLSKDEWSISSTTGILTQKAKKGASAQTLSFALAVPDVPELKASAEILKSAWEKLGAKVTIEIFDSSDLEQNVIVPRKFDALLFGESVGRSNDLFAFWHSSERNSPGLNIAEYTNAKADKLLESARATSDEGKRAELYSQFEKELLADIPAIFLYAPDFIYVVPKSLMGVSIPKISQGSERFSNINNWYLETESIWQIPWIKSNN